MKAALVLLKFTLIRGPQFALSAYVMLWQKNVWAGLACFMVMEILRDIAQTAASKAVCELTNAWVTIANTLTATRKSTVEHTVIHKKEKEEWEP